MTTTAEHLYQTGLSQWKSGLKQEAIDSLRRACAAAPSENIYAVNLAAALIELGQWPEAETMARHALSLEPERAATWHGLGNALTGQQRWLEAAQAYERAATLDPALPDCDRTAAQAWQRAGQPQAALQRYLRLLGGVNGRDDPEVLTSTARVLTQLDQLDQPLEIYRRVAQQLPDNAAAHSNLGIALQALGNYPEAIAAYRQALVLAPGLHATWSNLIVCLNYSPEHGPADVLEAAANADVQVSRALRDTRPYDCAPDPARRLRVGYVSPDLHRHAVAYFVLPLLQGHTQQVEVVCYNNHTQQDEWTAQLRQVASQWVDCHDWTDDALAERIRADRIDILVDLAGHTEGNRLLTFARKPAPVQVTWLGYVTTTGLSAMDWRMTYADTDPGGTDTDYVEKLWRLQGGMWGYRPLPGMPAVAVPPHTRKGQVTFGHFNRYSKVSPQALAAWAEILRQVPGARLVLGLPPGKTRQQVGSFFESRGVAANRIDACDKMPHANFWALHHEVDIALDPFPFNGGTTSYETLWLGVPLVTCTGGPGSFAPRFASRMGHALLAALGLPELVATTEADYVRIAVSLAHDSGRMATLRQELRGRMAASPLLDEALHVREIEAAYRSMWQRWCADPR